MRFFNRTKRNASRKGRDLIEAVKGELPEQVPDLIRAGANTSERDAQGRTGRCLG